MKHHHPLKEEYLQLKNAVWIRLWLLKQNQLPRIGAWLEKHSQTAVMATCFISGGFVIGQIAAESELQSRANDIHAASYADGFNSGTAARKEELMQQVTVQSCMNWLFNDDPTRVGKALKIGRLQ